MTVISNNMIITDDSLKQISRKIINKGIYDGKSIEVIGHPSIINGIATNLSETSYFKKAGIEIPEDYETLSLTFEGSIAPNEQECAFKLGNISLHFNGDTCSLNDPYSTLIQLTNSTMALGGQIKVSLLLTPEEVNLELIIDNQFVCSGTESLTERVEFSNPLDFLVGIDEEGSNDYWKGSIDLSSISIEANNTLIYSPTTQPSITFTHIMIGDGKYPLNDNSAPILNHVYLYPIEELTRSNSNILITATITEDAYLKIKEIGLYCTFGDGTTHLFSILGGLSLNKSADVGYDLIIHINLDINVVNTTVMPKIKIKEVE